MFMRRYYFVFQYNEWWIAHVEEFLVCFIYSFLALHKYNIRQITNTATNYMNSKHDLLFLVPFTPYRPL